MQKGGQERRSGAACLQPCCSSLSVPMPTAVTFTLSLPQSCTVSAQDNVTLACRASRWPSLEQGLLNDTESAEVFPLLQITVPLALGTLQPCTTCTLGAKVA